MPRGKGSFRMQFALKGVQDLRLLTRGMDMRDEMATIAAIIEDAAQPIIESARQGIDGYDLIRTGALRKSIGAIVRIYPTTGKVIGYVGARHIAYAGSTTQKTALPIKDVGPLQGDEQKVVPSKYIHLVHNGFYNKLIGRKVEKRPFLKDAFDQHRKQTEWVLINGASQALERVLKRNAARLNRSAFQKLA